MATQKPSWLGVLSIAWSTVSYSCGWYTVPCTWRVASSISSCTSPKRYCYHGFRYTWLGCLALDADCRYFHHQDWRQIANLHSWKQYARALDDFVRRKPRSSAMIFKSPKGFHNCCKELVVWTFDPYQEADVSEPAEYFPVRLKAKWSIRTMS